MNLKNVFTVYAAGGMIEIPPIFSIGWIIINQLQYVRQENVNDTLWLIKGILCNRTISRIFKYSYVLDICTLDSALSEKYLLLHVYCYSISDTRLGYDTG